MASDSISPDLLERSEHSTIILDGKLYSWGGSRLNIPYEHDSDKKRNLTSFVEVFDIPSLSWSRVPKVGIPPAAMMIYSCASINDTVYYFGGNCKSSDCYHNDVFAFSTSGNKWNQVLYTDTKNTPMKKSGSGMISFSSNKEDYLLTIGGLGSTPATIPSHSVYTPHPIVPNIMCTNEAHVLCVSSSPAHWTVPTVTGTRPPPSAYFTLNALPGINRSIIFGGVVFDNTGFYRTNDVYLITYTKDLVEYTKLECPSGGNCPKERAGHSSTVITANNSPHLLVIGGRDNHFQPTIDCWILDINKKKWKKIHAPDSVTRRYFHSISSYTVSDQCVWIIITGGFKQYNAESKTNFFITGPDTTVLVELVYSSDGWSVTGVWNGEQLVSNKTELQTRLIQHIVKDRIHKSSVMTTKLENQELRKTLREKTKENEKLKSDLSVSNSRLEGYMKLLLEKEELEKIHKKMSLVKTQELSKLQQSKGHVESVTEPGEQSTKKDDKSEILREEVEKLQSLVIEKDEELTQLSLKLTNLNNVVSTDVKDQGTQFNYIIPVTDCLDEVHVAGEVVHLIQGSHTQSLNWSQWGLRMHFAEDTVSATETCEVAVKALVGGKFKFPSSSQLISAVYAVSFASKVKKPVKVEIQHCALLKNEGQFQYLSFVKAPLRQKVPPFEFTPLKGGEFSLESQYGSIILDHFCLIAIILMFKDVIVFIPLKITNNQQQRRADSLLDSGSQPDTKRKRTNVEPNVEPKKKKDRISDDDGEESEHSVQDSGARNLQADGNSSETGSTEQRESDSLLDSAGSQLDTKRKRTNDDPDVEQKKKKDRISDDDDSGASDLQADGNISETGSTEQMESDYGSSNLQANGNSSETGSTEQRESGGSIDLLYTGQTYYECLDKANQWLVKFIAVKKLEALIMYIKENTPDAKSDQPFRFMFEDSNGVLELVMDVKQEKPAPGWTVLPHAKPLTILQEDMDDFGKSDGLPNPPTCLVTVYATVGPNTALHLNYSVPIRGVVTKIKEIFVTRLLDPSASSSQNTPVHVQPSPNALESATEGGASSQPVDTKAVITCIKEVLSDNFAKLMTVVENSLQEVSAKLFASRLISTGTNQKPSYKAIITELLSGLDFKNTLPLIIQHCEKLFSVFYELGGPFADAGDSLKQSIIETVREKLSINLSFD